MSHEGRPHIFLNFAMSVDGKISDVSRAPVWFTSRADRRRMDEIRADADAVLVGAGTIRAEDPPVRVRSRTLQAERRARGQSPHPLSIILSRTLTLPLEGRFFRDRSVRRLVVTTEEADAGCLERCASYAEVLRMGKGSVDIPSLCAWLFRRGVRRLLVEGGGAVNMAFFREKLVDEIYMTLCPVIIGGENAPTPVDGEGFQTAFPALELLDVRRVRNELFHHYRVVSSGQSGPDV